MNDCSTTSAIELVKRERGCSDHGFMGFTHALSAVAIFLVLTAFMPDRVYLALGSSSLAVLILAVNNLVGGCLSVDLDNTQSTAKSSLGLLGAGLSVVYRGVSVTIQTLIRSGRDDSEPDPHRGFFHTIVADVFVGILVVTLTSLNLFSLSLPAIGEVHSGFVFAMIFSWLNLHMALAGLAKSSMRKLKKVGGSFGELLALLFSLTITYALFTELSPNLGFGWLGVSIAAGMFIHTFGDCFTKAGSPILFPLPLKGKLWYKIRFTKITTGGVVEKYLFTSIFGVMILISSFTIIFRR